MKKKIFYWSPCLNNVGTIKSTINSALSLKKYDQNNEFEWTRQELWEEIAKLPKKQRKVVILRVTDGLSYRDISEITGMSEGTAKVNFHHGLKRLKEKLNND